MSCINCTDDVPRAAYGLFETEQYKQLDAANLVDVASDNDKPVSIDCLSVFSDIRRNSTRVLPLKASLTYTLVAVNFNDHAVTVSGEAVSFFMCPAESYVRYAEPHVCCSLALFAGSITTTSS
jgi:hypothetical protein